jgi:hypothetical protein
MHDPHAITVAAFAISGRFSASRRGRFNEICGTMSLD